MKQMIIGMLLAILAANVNCKHIIMVKPEVNITITSPGYPQFTNKSDEWLIGNEQLGGGVYIKCTVTFKRNDNDCKKGSLTLNDFTPYEICNNTVLFPLHSKYNTIKISFNLTKNNEAKLRCDATAMPAGRVDNPSKINTTNNVENIPLKQIPNEIVLKKYVRNHDITGNLTSDMNNKYLFKCEDKSTIVVRCKINVAVGIKYERPCDGFRFRLESKAITKWQCHSSEFYTYQTSSDQLKIIITSAKEVKGTIACEVMAINRIQHSQYKQLPSDPDYDSSELGSKALKSKKQTTCDCGWTNKQTRRIIFGRYTREHEFPWSVSLQYKSSHFHFCGGSIITRSHILTAAHCIGYKKPHDILVVMGTNDRTDSRISSGAKQILMHNYDTSNHEHDIALIVLENKITYTETVGPVCLPTTPPAKLNNQHVTAMGWGSMDKSEEGKKDPKLQKKTTLRVIDIESCSLDWNYHWDTKEPKVICTWGKNTDICSGDSGGPVVWHDPELNRFTLVGMPALCDSCVLRLPSAHTNVHHYFDWIQQSITNSSEPGEKTCYKID